VALIGLLTALAVVAATAIGVLFSDEERPSYTPADVSAALAMEGLHVSPLGRSDGGSALLPPDGSFTVLVLQSNKVAQRAFEPYRSDVDPETFEVLAGNVIVLADFSNSTMPLPVATRAGIMRAVERLRRTEGG